MPRNFKSKNGRSSFSNGSLLNLFSRHLRSDNANPAVIYKGKRMSYADLHELSEKVAQGIIQMAPAEEVVAVSATPSINLVAGLIGVLKSGKSFLAFDKTYGQEKMDTIKMDSGVKFIVCDERESIQFKKAGLTSIQVPAASTAVSEYSPVFNKFAYINFTSGSSGNCKGVKIPHRSITNYLRNSFALYIDKQNKNQCATYFHLNLGFDASLTSLFLSLMSGKCVVLASDTFDNKFKDPDFLKNAPYDFLKLTPCQLHELDWINSKPEKRICSRIVLGGENLQAAQLQVLSNWPKDTKIFNEYGPSETGIGSILFELSLTHLKRYHFNESIPIGKAMPQVFADVVNKNLETVKPGELGEIILGGLQLAEGYISRKDLSRNKFFTLTRENRRIPCFKTGDLATVTEQGIIEFVCREERYEETMLRGNEFLQLDPIIENNGLRYVHSGKELYQGKVYHLIYLYKCPGSASFDSIESRLKKIRLNSHFPIFCVLLENIPLTINKKLNKHILPKCSDILRKVEFVGEKEPWSNDSNAYSVYIIRPKSYKFQTEMKSSRTEFAY